MLLLQLPVNVAPRNIAKQHRTIRKMAEVSFDGLDKTAVTRKYFWKYALK